jgi:hypothetical protein
VGLNEPVGGEPAGAGVFDGFDEQPIARPGQTSSQRRPPLKTVHAEAGPVRIDFPRDRVVHPEDRRQTRTLAVRHGRPQISYMKKLTAPLDHGGAK